MPGFHLKFPQLISVDMRSVLVVQLLLNYRMCSNCLIQMATVKMNTANTEADQEGGNLSPSEEASSSVLNDTSAPLNFSELTPFQFGISVQSFTPAPLSSHKGKRTVVYLTPNCCCIYIAYKQTEVFALYSSGCTQPPLVETLRKAVCTVYCRFYHIICNVRKNNHIEGNMRVKAYYSHMCVTKTVTDAPVNTADALINER